MTEIKQKYIIKNCTAKPSDIKATYGWCSTYQIKCQDWADCLIKQIIEKCKEHPFKDCACGDEILQLFDIEVLNDRD
jgi:hypothetical protein